MTALKIKVKKAKMVRKIEGAKVTGFYGRVVSTGKKTFEEVWHHDFNYIKLNGCPL